MSLFDVLLSNDAPVTAAALADTTGRTVQDVEQELAQLLSQNSIRSRTFILADGASQAVFWSPTQIPFTNEQPIVTSPFSEPFDHREALERLSDFQLQQEKNWLQVKLRRVSSELENLQHRAKIKVDEETEKKLDALSAKWMDAIHDMLWDLHAKAKKANPEMTMDRLLKELRIEPDSVGWNHDEEDFC